jgi:hypothetical protein
VLLLEEPDGDFDAVACEPGDGVAEVLPVEAIGRVPLQDVGGGLLGEGVEGGFVHGLFRVGADGWCVGSGGLVGASWLDCFGAKS